MVLVTEVTATCLLLLKAFEFSAKIRDGLYQGSAELKEFQAKVAILNVKHAQWTSQLERFGMTEDEHLKPLIKAATEILDKEQDYVRRMQKSLFKKFKRRAFPGQLTYLISLMVEIVDAGPKQLEERVKNNDLLERFLGQTASPLPFAPFLKYVPLSDSITDVQKALEGVDGSLVVTLHGGPGMGKSSLVKYLALQYQNQKQQMSVESTTPVCFPHGVFYLFCGKEAHANELQLKLLASLGDGLGSSTPLNDSRTSAPNQEPESVHLTSHQKKLALRLAKQKSLIILDDVWELDVLEKLLVPSTSVKYLVTSQTRGICSYAKMIELKRPNKEEARKILANYTEGLPIKGEFPESIQSVTDAVIGELGHHPMSLASVGTTISKWRATDPGEWKALKDNLKDRLDESDFHSRELVYGTRYSHTVGASMMLMVDSLRPEARHLLFLMGLLKGRAIPEVLVKFFFNQIQPTGQRNKYGREIRYLEDKSLVEYHCHGAYDGVPDDTHTSRLVLVTHGLRIYYIRKHHTVDVIGVATEIFSAGSGNRNNHDGELVQAGCTDEALATIMGAMYIEKPFRDVVATKLESQSRIFNTAVIPRTMNYDVDALGLMDRAQGLKDGLETLVWLLNPDGEGGCKQQAHEYAKKIVIRLTFRNELDDQSMARLIQLPHTTIAASEVLWYLICDHLVDALEDAFIDQNITFSSVHGHTMKSLNDMCCSLDNVATANQFVFEVLGHALLYESEDVILSIAKKWVKFLAKESSPTLQIAVAYAISTMDLSRATILVGELPGCLDHLLMLTVEGSKSQVRTEAMKAIYTLCKSSTMASRIAAIPGALEMLFKMFLSNCLEEYRYRTDDCYYFAGFVLCRLSRILENKVRFTIVHGGLEGLTKMLASNPNSRRVVIHQCRLNAATILANLAMKNEIRKSICTAFPKVKEGLRLLELSCFSRNYEKSAFHIHTISRAMTILDPLQACPNITTSLIPPSKACYEMYMGRVQAYRQMQMYLEALDALNIAHEYHKQMNQVESWYRWEMTNLSRRIIFFKAMLEDYAGAMMDANSAIENCPNEYKRYWDYGMLLAERGVLKQLVGVDLAGALVDLDEALQRSGTRKFERYGCLKHRGLVKHMMGDEVGARADAESALQLKFRWLYCERTKDAMGPEYLLELPVNYLGFSL